jgi:hypothetical protein
MNTAEKLAKLDSKWFEDRRRVINEDRARPSGQDDARESVETFIDFVWDVFMCSGGGFSEHSGIKQIAERLEARDAAQRAQGRRDAAEAYCAGLCNTITCNYEEAKRAQCVVRLAILGEVKA